MRDKWYGDKRDLVKWGVLLELARRYKAKHILQVLYFRPSNWKSLTIDDEEIPLNSAVLRHFRDPFSVSKIPSEACIQVIPNHFTFRDEYRNEVLRLIRARRTLPGIVFLDPDTGLRSSASRHGLEHVTEIDLQQIWSVLQPKDILALYQHKTNRRGVEWISPKRREFEQALGIHRGSSKVGWSEGIANDVVIYFAEKHG